MRAQEARTRRFGGAGPEPSSVTAKPRWELRVPQLPAPAGAREPRGSMLGPVVRRQPRAVNTSGIQQTPGPQLVARRQRRLLAGRRSARSQALHEPLPEGSRAPKNPRSPRRWCRGSPGRGEPLCSRSQGFVSRWCSPAAGITSRHGRVSWRGGRGRGARGKGSRHLQLPGQRQEKGTAPSLIALALGKETSHFLARPAEPPRSAYPSRDAQEKKKKKKKRGWSLF